MTTAIAPIPSPTSQSEPAVPQDPIYRLSVEQYHEMIRSGILTNDDRVELLEGWLIQQARRTPRRSVGTHLMYERLSLILPEGWHAATHQPVTTLDSEPEPDVAIIRGEIRDYAQRHPGPEQVALLAEVADSSLERDRGIKRRIYARANVPVYWIIIVPERRIEVYTNPSGPVAQPVYRDVQPYGESESVPVVIDGREVGRIVMRDILP